ncbi:hypothetical protein FQZ97_1203660 [compost metagenome]
MDGDSSAVVAEAAAEAGVAEVVVAVGPVVTFPALLLDVDGTVVVAAHLDLVVHQLGARGVEAGKDGLQRGDGAGVVGGGGLGWRGQCDAARSKSQRHC